MPVKLFTGLPGAGKTAGLVAEIIRLRKDEPDRPIFQMGINGLVEGFAATLTMQQLENWREELPPGSIICLDECQEDHLFPKDNGLPKKWVKEISKVRHEGMDFLMTTQHPSLMSAYVRRLVDRHVHFERKFNTGVVMRFSWDRCMDLPEKPAQQKSGSKEMSTLPKEVFELYKSSNAHNMKRKLPKKFFIFCGLVVGAAVAIPLAFYLVTHLGQKNQALISGGVGTSAAVGGTSAAVSEDQALRRKDFAQWQRPRVAGIPWTAPMFDALTVTTQPRLYCIAVDDGRCVCHTEQGTRSAVEPSTCRAIAANGLYNPFAGSLASMDSGQRSVSAAGGSAQPPQPQAQAAVLPSSAGGHVRATAMPYVPPTMAAWNSDPFGSGSKR